ncbi:MAG: hypothetical protein LBQ58_11005 [Synergistaceae bacterium]|jgi:hypothetical protein|nr:hypothetical protein [Synergistaceae bacterium]
MKNPWKFRLSTIKKIGFILIFILCLILLLSVFTPGGGGGNPSHISGLVLFLELDYLSSMARDNIDTIDKFKDFKIEANFLLKKNFQSYLSSGKYISNDLFTRLSNDYPEYHNIYNVTEIGKAYGFNVLDTAKFFIRKSPVSSDVIFIEKKAGREMSKKKLRQYLKKLEDKHGGLLFKNTYGDPYDGGKSVMIKVHLM